MKITKCDICKKNIKDNKVSVNIVGEDNFYNYQSFEFCGECGKSIKDFLIKKKLLKLEKTKIKN